MSERLLDRFRVFLARWLVSPLMGITLGDWLRVLAENRWLVGPRFWPRALFTTVSATSNSLQARRERRTWGEAVGAVRPQAPIFVLGHYRNGTTHLHNLLAQDARFAFVNNYQANFPRTFLSTETVGTRLGRVFTMRKRPHDNVALDLSVPTEDELALCADTFLSPHMAWHFPRRASFYERRYLTFEDASEQERQRWKSSLRTLVAKLTLKHGRRLVLKSPLHTARIPLLLEAFPDALFVHLHRDPLRVYQSTRHMEIKVEPLFRYQGSRPENLDDRIFWRYRTMYRAYLRDRQTIPAGRLVEIAYADLDADASAALQQIYEGLGLPDFEVARTAVERYLRSLRGYRKNRYAPLSARTLLRIDAEWGFALDAFGYARPELPESSRSTSTNAKIAPTSSPSREPAYTDGGTPISARYS